MVLTISQQQMVEKNQAIVVYCIDKLLTLKPNLYEEAFSVGLIGLCKAAISFNSNKNTSFSSFACKVVKNEILRYIYSENKHLNNIHFEEDNEEDGRFTVSIDEIADINAISIDECIEKRNEIANIISILLNCFSGKNRLISLYFFAGIKQKDIASKFNISRSSVAMIVKKVKERLFEMEEHCEEIFFVELKGSRILISFFINNKNKEILAKNFLSSTNLVKLKNNKCIMSFPIERESLSLIADFIKEVDSLFNI